MADRLPLIRAVIQTCLLLSISLSAGASDIDAIDYEATIRVSRSTEQIDGTLVLRLRVTAGTKRIALAAENLSVQSVDQLTPAPVAAAFEVEPRQLRVDLPAPGQDVVLRIRYTARPKRGVRFRAGEAVTYFHTPAWLPCVFDPADRATLTMHLEVARGDETLSNGLPTAVEDLPGDLVRHTWREEQGYSAYLFGFAVGTFRAVPCARPKAPPVVMTAAELSEADRAALCERYPAMFRFFEQVAGIPYPGTRFTVAWAKEGLPQEAADYAVLPREYGAAVLREPVEDYLLAHELAHAWWGNWITCADWREFWLNEGMVTFLTSAFKERLWGADEYDRERFLSRRRMARVAASGKGRALVPAAATAEDAGGTVPYSQGALVLHLLRTVMGERAFWNGLRAYTRGAARGDRLARTGDLERAMSRASRSDVHFVFEQWVRSAERLQLEARHEISGRDLSITLTQAQSQPWTVPLRIAVETTRGRIHRQIVLSRHEHVVRIRVPGPVLSVRIDDGGHLPERIAHAREPEMLMWQTLHEPDALGRAEALEALIAACADEQKRSCTGLDAVLEASRLDRARLVRQQVPKGAP